MAITTVIRVAIYACYLPHESMGALNCVVRRKNRTQTLKLEEWLEHTITGGGYYHRRSAIKVVILIIFCHDQLISRFFFYVLLVRLTLNQSLAVEIKCEWWNKLTRGIHKRMV
jgi:hypothetical protein